MKKYRKPIKEVLEFFTLRFDLIEGLLNQELQLVHIINQVLLEFQFNILKIFFISINFCINNS